MLKSMINRKYQLRMKDMEDFYCILYFAVTGILGFIAGRLIPKKWFRYDAPPYRCLPFEKEGAIYNKLKIKAWQNKVPDMSRIFPRLMPPKRLDPKADAAALRVMLQETCAAEFIHSALCITGLGCFFIRGSRYKGLFYILYVLLLNLPFIIIQRYNRPRLAKLLRRYENHIPTEQSQRSESPCAC